MVAKHVQRPKSKKGASAAMIRGAAKMSARQPKAALKPSPTVGEDALNLQIRGVVRRGLRARGYAILSQAASAGYLRGQKTERVGGRVTRKLLSAAKAKSGLTSQTELLEYALSKVAVEDDYGAMLLSMKGSVPDDVEL
jgi:hypothetical protein